MTGNFAANNNKYYDGEANYKLPIFNSKKYNTDSLFLSRGVAGHLCDQHRVWLVSVTGVVDITYGVRPLIYLR